MVELRDYLQMKCNIKPSTADYILSFFDPTVVRKNDFFLRSGSRCNQIAFIRSGVMRNYEINADGNEVVKYMTSDGDFNTIYQNFVNGESGNENIQALTDCQLMTIDRRGFFELKASSLTFREMLDQLVIDGLECKEQRLMSYLNDDAQKRYENMIAHQPKIIQYAPMQHVASYLGMTRETLSRIRKRRVSNA